MTHPSPVVPVQPREHQPTSRHSLPRDWIESLNASYRKCLSLCSWRRYVTTNHLKIKNNKEGGRTGPNNVEFSIGDRSEPADLDGLEVAGQLIVSWRLGNFHIYLKCLRYFSQHEAIKRILTPP